MRTISSTYLKMIFKGCLELGQVYDGFEKDLRRHFPDAGRNLDNPMHRCPRQIAGALLNETVSVTGDKAVGLKVGMQMRPESLFDIGYAFTVCNDLMEVMALNQKYQPLIQQIGTTELTVSGSSAWLKWTPLYDDTDYYAQFVEMIFAGYAVIGRWLLYGQDAPVLATHFRHDAPKDTSVQRGLFCENLIYNSNFDGIEFVSDTVKVPMPNRNPEMLAFLRSRLDKRLANFNAPVTAAQETLSCIQAALPDGRPSIKKIAKTLGMSDRTLRRRLEAEGQTYREVLERARIENCEAYMRAPNISQADMALRLGFSDQTAFSRAFKTWFQQTPSDYRQALGGSA